MDRKTGVSDFENLLVHKEGFFKSLLDNMRIGVIVSDHEGHIVYLNDTYARFLEIDPKAQIGKHATKLGVNSRLHIVAKTGKAEVNYPHQLKDKGYLVHRVPIKEDGKVIAVLGLVLFDSAGTAGRLAEKLLFLESKLHLYESELISLRSTRYTFDSVVGVSEAIITAKSEAVRAARNNFPVLITGESGTGKELFAQAIHHASSRKPYPFVRVNCAAIPGDLFESELFGYERGSFTGADPRGKAGKFELANYGTVFLDEIGDLPLEMQPKLLRVIEGKEFERVGGSTLISADFRVLSATNQNLEEMLKKKRFRKDLFYRLNVIPINIPPLRKRRDDIIPLACHLLKQIGQELGFVEIKIDPQAEEALRGWDWPGNVRELSNVLERVVSSLEGEAIYLCDLPFYLFGAKRSSNHKSRTSLKSVQGRAEKEAIRYALESANYNKARAAAVLGIHRSLLYKKIKKYNLPLNQADLP
jgi:transcriptional regulator with PAS, ATPase and Fis domain